jgi:hypothetical protein
MVSKGGKMWKINIADDADSTGERTITGTWTDKTGEFSFSLRGRPDAKGQDTFIEAAMKARDEWQEKKSTEKEFVTNCLSKLNVSDSIALAKAVA